MGAQAAKKDVDVLSLSDEEFSKLEGPPESLTNATLVETPAAAPAEEPAAEPAAETEQPETQTPAEGEKPAEEGKPAEETPAEEPVAEKQPAEGAKPAAPAETPVAEGAKPAAQAPAATKPAAAGAAKPDEKPVVTAAPAAGAPDYKALYERMMAPFKANGKLIQLQSPDEAVQLMQMGANYTRKMQELGQGRKFLMMLQNNELLDEGKLSFLIDLDKKNPEAIKKLLVDAKIDPVEVDTTKVNYRGGAHAVSDQEVALENAIQDLNGQEGGRETLKSINASWDEASKKALWENPDLLAIFHQQRVNGIYDRITAEMERRRTFGQLSSSVPFLAAYKQVGDELAARGAFQSAPGKMPPSAASGQQPAVGAPVAVKTAPAKTPAAKAVDPRVRAAAPTRTTPQSAQPAVNYLAMSDEEFMKLANKV